MSHRKFLEMKCSERSSCVEGVLPDPWDSGMESDHSDGTRLTLASCTAGMKPCGGCLNLKTTFSNCDQLMRGNSWERQKRIPVLMFHEQLCDEGLQLPLLLQPLLLNSIPALHKNNACQKYSWGNGPSSKQCELHAAASAVSNEKEA